MLHFKFLTIIFILFTCFNLIICDIEECTAENDSNCGRKVEQKYSREANHKHSIYLKRIEEAEESYEPCSSCDCKCHSSVISNDLKPFKNGVTKAMLENVKSKGTKYQIINSRLYREKDCMFPARCSGIEYFILKQLPDLPDMELIVNTRDWPQIHKQYGEFGPVFSFSKTEDYYDIMYPAWAFWEGGPAISLYPKGIGKWEEHRQKIAKVANETNWEKKTDKAFFRGSRTSSDRDPLVLLSREHPELVDAQYTKNQAWKSDADTLHAPPATEVSFTDHCRYKYLFNFRGVAASFRFKHILLCKSVVFHVGDEWLEFFYPSLKPWIHYIPVNADADEKKLKDLLEFARDNPKISQRIADNGFSFVWNHLKMKDVRCYWRKLLTKYAKLLKFKPELDENLIEINLK